LRVLIFEPDHTGHHFLHLGLLIPPLAALGVEVIVATTEAARATKPYEVYLKPLESSAKIDAWMPPMAQGGMEIAKQKLRCFGDSIARAKPDWVCVPYADGLAQVLGAARKLGRNPVPRDLEVCGLMMRGLFAYPHTGLKQKLAARASWQAVKWAPLSQVYILDPIVFNAVMEEGGSFAARCGLLPEPMDPPPAISQADARRKLGIPEDGRYIGCVGLIDRRKGCDLLVRAFAAAKIGASDRLLLVGGHDPEIRQLIAGECGELVRSGRIISIDRFVDPDELGAALLAMDLVCTPYPRHIGSASVVIRAAAAGRPVVGSEFGWVRWAIEKFRLGQSCNVESIDALAAALTTGLDAAPGYRLTEGAQRWVRFHTPENFALTWTARVRQKLGLPAAPALHTWEWVERGSVNSFGGNLGSPPRPS